jgi:hypothetical protein
VKIFRAVVALVLAALGCWCLFWLPLFLALALFANSSAGWSSYLILAAWVVGFFGAAFLIQPWWRRPWERRSPRL